jgi:hypothetical protein
VSLAGIGPPVVTVAATATVEVRTPAAAAGAGRPRTGWAKRAGGVGTDGSAGGAVPPPSLGSGAIRDGAPRRGDTAVGDTTGPGQGTGPEVGPTGGEWVPVGRGRIGGSATVSVGKGVKRSGSGLEEGGVVV